VPPAEPEMMRVTVSPYKVIVASPSAADQGS
jgi:hypothetical protein